MQCFVVNAILRLTKVYEGYAQLPLVLAVVIFGAHRNLGFNKLVYWLELWSQIR